MATLATGVNIPKKLVASACYDKQHICAYLQPFHVKRANKGRRKLFKEGAPLSVGVMKSGLNDTETLTIIFAQTLCESTKPLKTVSLIGIRLPKLIDLHKYRCH